MTGKSWAEDTDAVERFVNRMNRIEKRQSFNSMPIPVTKIVRPPSIAAIKQNQPHMSNPLFQSTPFQGNIHSVQETFEEVEEMPVKIFTPQSLGKMTINN